MSQPRIYRRSYRIRKAYWTAFRVMFSYLWLSFKSKLFGQKYYEKRIIILHARNAELVKNGILKLGGLFIKIGQLLSILTNYLPQAFQEPLEALQDQIPARPFKEIEDRIVKELGDTPANLFASFDKEAIAAASIGQVHRATLKDGLQVAVKVQHKNIENIAEVDLHIMQRLVQWTALFFDIKGLNYAYTQVKKMIEEELDFQKEAQSMQIIGEHLADEPLTTIPTIIEPYCTTRVLTTKYLEGVKINDIQQLETWGLNRTDLANRLVHLYCKMVFEYGVYHADPHPGNILVQSDGTIVLLDFGAVAHIQPTMRTGLLALIDGAAKNDDAKIINALRSMGFIANNKSAGQIAEKIVIALRHFLQNEVQIDGLNFKNIKVSPFETSLFGLIKELGVSGIANTIQVPKDYVLLNRMVTLLLGICNSLDSSMNPLDLVQPYLKKYILGEQGNMVQFLSTLLKGSLANILSLPMEVHKTLKLLQKGELEWNAHQVETRNKVIYLLGHQFIYTILFIASIYLSFLFYKEQDYTAQKYTLGFGAVLFFLLLRSMWKHKSMSKFSNQ